MVTSRHALVVAYLALILAMSGTAYALSVDGGDVVNGSLTGLDIKSDSVPESDLNFNAVRPADMNVEAFSIESPIPLRKDGTIIIKGKDITLGGGFNDALAIGTFSIRNTETTPAQIEIRPYVDGKPHGEQVFTHVIQPNATNLSTVSSTYELGKGIHSVELRLTLVSGEGVTVEEGAANWLRVSNILTQR